MAAVRPAKGPARFDVAALRDLAGEKVFSRGKDYFLGGEVRILACEADRVLAQVAGTDDYQTVLTGRGKRIAGHCSCPAFDNWGFCKHMVATALAANAGVQSGEAEGVGALSNMRAYLKAKGVDALVDIIVGLAETDAALFRKLDIAASTVLADDKTLETRLRKAIVAATRTGDYIDYRRAGDWAEGVDEVLGAIGDLPAAGRADLALRLAEHAIERIEAAIGDIDDSDGHCGGLLEHAQQIHLAAALIVRPEPVQLARELFAREIDGDYDTFSGAAEDYADVLGEEGLAEFRRLALDAWGKLPPRPAQARARVEFSSGYYQLKGILDVFAERDGDIDARIALRSKDLSSPWSYLELAEFCLSQGRESEALRHAEEGLWLFEDGQPDQRLVFFTASLLSKAGRAADAQALLGRTFEKSPSLEVYARLRQTGGKVAGDRAIAFLRSRLPGQTATRWHSPADLLIQILTKEKAFDAAWATARAHGASTTARQALAYASEADHPGEALETYAERIDQLVGAGGDHAYAEASGLVRRMAGLRDAARQADYVTELKLRFARRRNFTKLLG